MSVIQIGIAASALLIGIIALVFFNKQAINKHHFAFFTVASFIMTTISLSMMIVGVRWFINASSNSDDVMNGIGMGVIGVIVALFLVLSNRSKTSLVSAISALSIQFIILGALAYFAINF